MKAILTSIFMLIIGMNYLSAQRVKESDVPKQVLDSLKKYYPHAEDVEWEKNQENYEAEYEVDRAVLIDPKGNILANKNDILPKNLPEPILNYFRDVEKSKVKVVRAQRVIMADGRVFFLAISKDHIYKFNAMGKLKSKEAFD